MDKQQIDGGKLIPTWITLYVVFNVLPSLAIIYVGFFDPDIFYSDYGSKDWSDPILAHLTGFMGATYIAAIIALLASLIMQNAMVLTGVFLFKFSIDTINILVLDTIYITNISFFSNVLTWAVLGLPQLIAVIVLCRKKDGKKSVLLDEKKS